LHELEHLELLLRLQEIDLTLSELESDEERLPDEMSELEKEKERARADVAEREQGLEEGRKRRQHLERDLEDQTVRLNDLKAKQLMIKTNEEYAALSHEITFADNEIASTEDAILELMEDLERQTSALAAAKEAAASETAEVERKVGELKAEFTRLIDALAVKRDERVRVAMHVDKVTLARYERILASKGDFAVVSVEGGACRGCYVTLPPQAIIEVKRSDRLIQCDGCGRILYWRLERDDG